MRDEEGGRAGGEAEGQQVGGRRGQDDMVECGSINRVQEGLVAHSNDPGAKMEMMRWSPLPLALEICPQVQLLDD